MSVWSRSPFTPGESAALPISQHTTSRLRSPGRASRAGRGRHDALDARRLELRRPFGGTGGPANRMLGQRTGKRLPAAPTPDYEDARHGRAALPPRARRRSSSRQRRSRRHLGADVGLGDLGASAGPAAAVLGLDHLVHVVDLELGLDLGRSGGSPVHLLSARAGIPAPDREKDPEQDQPAERDECRKLVHAGRVYAPGRCPTPCIVDALRTPIGRYAGGARARPAGRPCRPSRSPQRSSGTGSTRRRRRGLHRLRQPGGRGQPQRGADGIADRRAAQEVPGVTVNRLCASGLEAVARAPARSALGEARPRARRRRRVDDARSARRCRSPSAASRAATASW